MHDGVPGQDVPDEFWDTADQFIDLANHLAKEWPRSRVSAAMMYAAARFNAFNATSQDTVTEEMRDEVIEYFSAQYRKMFVENLDDLLGTEDG